MGTLADNPTDGCQVQDSDAESLGLEEKVYLCCDEAEDIALWEEGYGDAAGVAEDGDAAEVAENGDAAEVAEDGDAAGVAEDGDAAEVAESGDAAEVAENGDAAEVVHDGEEEATFDNNPIELKKKEYTAAELKRVCRAGKGIRENRFNNIERCFMAATDGIKRKSIITCPTITTGGPYVLRTQKKK